MSDSKHITTEKVDNDDIPEIIRIDVIFDIISSYLNYLEKQILIKAYNKQNSPRYKSKNKPFSQIVKERLGELIPNPDIFLKQVAKGKGVISGSFILQCIYE